MFYFRKLNLCTIFMLPFQIIFKLDDVLHLTETCNLINKENICA
jgi:hypothetical protein